MDGRSLRDIFPNLSVSEQLILRVAFAGPVASWLRPATNPLAVFSQSSTSMVRSLAISWATAIKPQRQLRPQRKSHSTCLGSDAATMQVTKMN